MPRIELSIGINADKETVFDLSRSIDAHVLSAKQTNEKAISGRTSGLIELDETVTWRAKHLGIYQELEVKITAFDRPNFFVDEMVRGAFKSFRHEHHFKEENGITIMKDVFDYQSPLGILGRLADVMFLERYMTTFLIKRNTDIKRLAENGLAEKYSKSQ